MAGTYWDKEEVVGEVDKDLYSKYIVSACEKNGKKFINVREWYHTQADPTWKPSKSGMAIPDGVAQKVLAALGVAASK